MDKKAKKKIDTLHKRIGQLQQRLSGARKQMDDPQEVERLEAQIRAAEADLERLTAG